VTQRRLSLVSETQPVEVSFGEVTGGWEDPIKRGAVGYSLSKGVSDSASNGRRCRHRNLLSDNDSH
jgi:hypothetical protein